MDPLEYLLNKLSQIEGRITIIQDQILKNDTRNLLAMEEMSKTIGLMMAQLLPILNERKLVDKAMKEAVLEQLFEHVAKTQKYLM